MLKYYSLRKLHVHTIIIISALHVHYIMWLKCLVDSSGREWDENGMDYGFRMTQWKCVSLIVNDWV